MRAGQLPGSLKLSQNKKRESKRTHCMPSPARNRASSGSVFISSQHEPGQEFHLRATLQDLSVRGR